MPDDEKVCPFIFAPVPGKIQNTINLLRPPCVKEKCALWMCFKGYRHSVYHGCAFTLIPYLIVEEVVKHE